MKPQQGYFNEKSPISPHHTTVNLSDKRIKVLHLIKSLGRGGAEKLIPETALIHDREKFEFHCLYFYQQKQNIVDELEAAGIQVHLIPSGNLGLFFQVKKVKEFVEAQQFDILHAHLPWAGILARFVGQRLAIPIVYTEHNTWERYNKLSYWGNRLTFKHQDVAIAVSNEVALSMQLNSIFDPYKRGGRLHVKVVQNGVNTEEFRREGQRTKGEGQDWNSEVEGIQVPTLRSENRTDTTGSREVQKSENRTGAFSRSSSVHKTQHEDLRRKLGIPDTAPVIGKVAVFRTQKRLWLWIDVALRILEKHPHVHFLLVGDGEWKARIEKQIQESGKGEHFHLVGVQKHVIPYLSLMDIYLSSSEFEGLPIAMLEAMSCEVPVVATRAGGIGEVIQHGVQGYLTEIEDWEKLEEYCLRLLTNQELHREMALAARERVIEKFSMVRMVCELEGIYREVSRLGKK
jgi:glycosyltransferase involved in cell wall biosynthesis